MNRISGKIILDLILNKLVSDSLMFLTEMLCEGVWVLRLVAFSHWTVSYVSGVNGDLQDTWWKHWVEGYSCMLVERGGEEWGGRSRFPSQFGSAPPPSSGYPLTLTHILVCLSQSKSFAVTLLLQTTTPSFPVQLVMTHCAAEAKLACVCAITGLVRALRSRLKALRRLLLLAGTDGSRQRPAQTFDGGRWERPGLLNRKNGGILGCCGPAHPSMAVSSPECVSEADRVTSRCFLCVCVSYRSHNDRLAFMKCKQYIFIFVDLKQ